MKLKILKRPQAKRDIIKSALYIAEDNQRAAEEFLDTLEKTFEDLSKMPNMGVGRDYVNPRLKGMRMWPVPNFEKYLIFYLRTKKSLEIVRLIHASRNIEEIFKQA